MSRRKYSYVLIATIMALLILAQPYALVARQTSAPASQTLHETPTPTLIPLAAPDSPADAPDQRARAATLQAGETTITYQLGSRKVKFQVSDGWDLDQYLFANSSPLDFYIDLQGFKPHPSKPAKVTLRVYDVDQAGDPDFPECQVEVDKVYLNGTFLGNLTGANNQWSIVTFTIAPGSLNEGSNHFWVDIDILTRSCWAVQVDWAEVEIPFNIAQVEASAFDDVTIKRGKTDNVITDPIWKTSFDASGNVISPANPNDPIADKILGAPELKYKYKIGTWPSGAQPTWIPKVKYAWEIQGTGQSSGGFQEQTGWENDFKVILPDKVGKYVLKVTLKIYREDDLLRTENRTHTLYVVLDSPAGPTSVSGGASIATSQPRTAWLDIATDWASGKNTQVDILDALNSREYGAGSNPLGWGYGYPKYDPVTLIESGAGKNGDCFVFRDVWRILAATLGIGTSSTEYRPSNGFMTSTRPALDGNASANARNKASGNRDRWLFSNHQYGLYGGTFYDPTYGLKGPNTIAGKESNVFCKIGGIEGGRWRCNVLSPPPAKALLAPAGLPSVNGWDIVEYETVATLLSSQVKDMAARVAAQADNGRFTGNASDTGYDNDGNGLFEHLQVDVEVDVTEAGTFAFLAALTTASGDLITLGSLAPNLNRDAPVTSATLATGVQDVSIYFNGRDIRTFGANGPYTVSVGLFDEGGTLLDTADFTTGAYSHLAFQSLLGEVQSVSDSGVDTDGAPGYNLLRIATQINVLAAANLTVQGQLFAGSTFLGDVTAMANWGAGTHNLNVDFPGAAIAASGLDGPYTVYLSVNDGHYTGNVEHTTAAYSHTAFQQPNAYFTGNVSDSGNDTNGNSLYDELNVVAEIATTIPATYTVHAILQDSAGSFIDAAEATLALGNTPAEATLSFDGLTINRHGVDGPYQVFLALADTAGNDLVGLNYTTHAYAYTDFEHPGALFDGNFADSGVDTDSDGFYNLLRINVGVTAADAGTYTVEGSLHDNDGNFITGAQTDLFLNTGTNTVDLNFDGTAIYAHGLNGPYQLRALELSQTGVGTMDSILEAYNTSAYAYTDFQPLGLRFTGNFADHGEDTNGNGLYDALVVDMELLITQSDTYYFNARLVDASGEEIVWASSAQSLTPGTQWVSLRFDGRYIYGNGVDGPYDVKDLSFYSGSQSSTLLDAHTTGAYAWQAFEPSAVVSGTVTVGGQPVRNANIFISGVDSDLTNSSGAYRLAVLDSGTFVINIDADPSLSPWQIWVNGIQAAEGTSVAIQVVMGEVTQVNFVRATYVYLPLVMRGNIVVVNNAPVLNPGGHPTLTAINEDEIGNSGTLISDIITSVLPLDMITDADPGALEGMAVIAADNDDGDWEYSTDGGSTWAALGNPSPASARLLDSDANTRIRFVPNANFNGPVDLGITFRAWDQTSGINGGTADTTINGGETAFSTDTETASITVNPVNDPPEAMDDTATTPADTPRTIAVLGNDIDPENDPLSIAAVGAPANGMASSNLNGTLTYTPNLSFTGADVFTYTIRDTGSLIDTATVTVSVDVANQAPNAVDDIATTFENTSVTIAVLNNDSDPQNDTLAVVSISDPANGSVSLEGSSIVYTPDSEFNGVDTFTYTVSDGSLSDTAVVTVTVGVPSSNPWEEDHFDELVLGPLHGQNGWTKAAAYRASAEVIAEGGGKVLKIDAAPGATIVMGKDVPDQTSGRHTFVVRAKVTGPTNPAEPTLAKIEVRTDPGTGWTKKFQLYFGAHMRVNYSPTGAATIIVPTIIEDRWYHIRGELDLEQELLDVWVDGVLAASDIPMHPGPITDLGLSGWDRPGAVFLDDIVGFKNAEGAPAGACYWINSQGGLWTTATNWSTGVVPDASCHAFIRLGGTYSVTLNTSTTVGSLTLGAMAGTQTLWIRGNSSGGNAMLTVNNNFSNTGVIRLESANAGWASNLTIASGVLTNTGVISVNQGTGGPRTISGMVVNPETLNVNHNLTFNGVLTNTGTLNINTGQKMSLAGSGQVLHQNDGTIAGSGVVELSNGATLNFNSGTTGGAAPLLTNANLNFGPAASGVATFILRGSSQLRGDIGAEQTVWVRGDSSIGNATVTAASGFSNAGIIRLESENAGWASNLTIASGVLTNTGVISVNQGTGGSRTISGDMVNQGTVNISRTLTFNGVFTNTGTVNIATGQTIDLNTSTEAFNQNSGTIVGQGFLNLSSGAKLNYNGGTTSGAAPLLTHANLNFGPAASGVANFILRGNSQLSGDIGAAQTVWVRGDSGVGNTTVTAVNGFTNAGVIRLESENAGWASNLTIASGILTNIGVISVNQGTGGLRILAGNVINQDALNVSHSLTFNGVFTNTGTVTIGTGQKMSLSGSAQVFNQTAGTIAGSGVLELSSGATLNFNSGTTGGAAPLLMHANLNFGPAPNGVANFILRGSSQLRGDIGAEQTVWVRGDGGIGNTTVTAPSGFTSAGVIRLESENAGWASNLTIASGVLTNTGVISVNQGTGGQRVISGTLINSGAINISLGSSQSLNVTGMKFENAGSGVINGMGTLNVLGTLFTNAGQINPGGSGLPGILNITGAYSQTVTGVLNIELGGLSPAQFDRLAITGSATLDGTLNASLINGFTPSANDSFQVMTYGSRTGAFAAINCIGWTCTPNYNPTNLTLVAQ